MNKITVTEEQASKFAKLHHGVSAASHLIADMQATLQSFADDVLAPALSQHPTILSAVKDEPFIHPGSFDPVPDFDLNAHLAKSGFVLAPGQAWHKPELFTVEDLAEGMRPLLVGEIRQKEDETRFEESGSKWGPTLMAGYSVPAGSVSLFRARRPLPAPTPDTFEAHGYTWTRHTPGDPMPCDGDKRVQVLFSGGTVSHNRSNASRWDWGGHGGHVETLTHLIIGYRVLDTPPQPAQEVSLEELGRLNFNTIGGPSEVQWDDLCESSKHRYRLAAKAIIEAATAPLRAEVERLRADRDECEHKMFQAIAAKGSAEVKVAELESRITRIKEALQ